jgi:hypothetical protein
MLQIRKAAKLHGEGPWPFGARDERWVGVSAATIPVQKSPAAAERGRSVAHVHDRRRKAGSELGRQIPVDLEADADLNENRGGPGH